MLHQGFSLLLNYYYLNYYYKVTLLPQPNGFTKKNLTKFRQFIFEISVGYVCNVPTDSQKKILPNFVNLFFVNPLGMCSVVQEKVCRITCVRRTCLRIVVVVSQCFDVIIRRNASTQCFDTMLRHNYSTQCFDSMLRHNASTRYSKVLGLF